ncbi:MAG: ORF6N domain-containing protein [Legionellaceae bacterium]|nr:ORF6N domain-containing protein [Legionellaceae bacterium]
MKIAVIDTVEDKIIELHHQHVIIDSDVAELYGVDTKRINEAVSRNLDKFPEGYLIQLAQSEWEMVKSQFATSPNPLGGGKVRAPKAFTERGLYMLATILKSPQATETTLAIIDTFAKVREISRTIKQLPNTPQNTPKYQQLLHKTGDLIAELVVPEDLDDTETEASIEVNLAIVKFKYSVKKKSK